MENKKEMKKQKEENKEKWKRENNFEKNCRKLQVSTWKMFRLAFRSRTSFCFSFIFFLFYTLGIITVFVVVLILIDNYSNDQNTQRLARRISVAFSFFGLVLNLFKWVNTLWRDVEKELSELLQKAEEKADDIEAGEIQTAEAAVAGIKKRMKIRKGESITAFVHERTQSNQYVDNLGVVHQAQLDLQRLSDAMIHKENEDKFPRGEPRIVIAIDDLDRCPPERVIEVLEAMQLIVKTPLFVVVAAIDARYVCKSLEEKTYKDILRQNQAPTGLDFHEKIIQIPYRVPIISEDSARDFVSSKIQEITETEENSIVRDPKEDEEKNNEREPKENEVENNEPVQVSNDGNDIAKLRELLDQSSEEPSLNAQQEFQQTVTSVIQRFTKEEADLLRNTCASLKLTPRAINRIVNVFMLMKRIWEKRRFEDTNDKVKEKSGEDSDEFKQMRKDSMLLLVLASSEITRLGLQRVFSAMEENDSCPMNSSSKLCDFVKKCLAEGKCNGIAKIPNDSLVDNIGTDDDWQKVIKKFRLARTFSFFYNLDDNKEDKTIKILKKEKGEVQTGGAS